LLGVALAQAGENAAAIETLERCVALEPGNAAAHFNLGQLYRQAGRRDKALAEFEQALALRPDYPAAARAARACRSVGVDLSNLESEAPRPQPSEETNASPQNSLPGKPSDG